MPKIIEYKPQVQSQVVPQARAQNVPAAAFGGPVAQGLSNVADATAQFADRISTTQAEDALVSFERDKNNAFYDPEKGYFNTQGRNAFDTAPEMSKTLESIKKQYGEGLDPISKQKFDSVADKHIARGQVDIQRHAAKGFQAWEIATVEAQVENTIENASLYWNQPDQLKLQRILGEQAILDASEMSGIGAEATNEKLQTFNSVFAKSTITAALGESSASGKEAMEQYGESLEGPDKVKLDKAIETKVSVEKTQSDANQAVLTSVKLVDQYDSRAEIIEEVDKIEDIELRKKTMSESMSRFSRREQARSEAEGVVFENAEDFIAKGGTIEAFKSGNPGEWELLSKSHRRTLESGKVISTEWDKFSDLMLLPPKELKKVDPTKYFSVLNASERKTLISAVKSANGRGSKSDKDDNQVGRSRTAQTASTVDLIFGKKSKLNNEEKEKVNQFYSLLDSEVRYRESQKGDVKLTSEEFTSLLADLSRKTVEEGFFYDDELDISDVPAKDVKTISEFLRDNNIPITSDNLIKAYKQASK